MRLKHYQEKVIKALKDYLGELDIARNEYEEMPQIKLKPCKAYQFSERCVGEINRQNYLSFQNKWLKRTVT